MQDLFSLQRKVNLYKEVLANTQNYRKEWKLNLRNNIINTLNVIIKETGLEASITTKVAIDNLEAIIFSLGDMGSGLTQQVGTQLTRELVKQNGTLIYQQLFNGKIIVLIQYPMIENYGEPRPPKTVAIYRPEELKEPFFVRHVENFIKEITDWEDYDDDEPNNKIGFKMNFENQ
ncbi:MAG: hypothetical protein ACI97N_001996 [Cognaticolwellia sp.]|jgi:hypothetical protein|tara:strand:- start:35 stop:559 length:525 start_codon:yes stop_codon:yes gene_type:complete